ncbi:unnamed protein product [Ilex paraguariensis]|uniref:Putative plant transposon protein domain-containing protein n=1 Tax=Ilex paraguariensis TaxID=185542 RepID=A0ABC8T7G1_9AQUA
MVGGKPGPTKKRKATNMTTKQVGNAQKKNDGETGKSSNVETGFLNKEAKTLFETCFCHRPLLVERGIALGELVNTNCPKFFGGRNWENIFDVKKDAKVYKDVVRLFFANLHDFDKVGQTLKSVVRGKEIEVFLDFISIMLKVPRLVICENTIVFPYKSKEKVPSMETVIETICDVAIEWVDENSKIYQKDLHLAYRMLNIIVACNINPKGHIAELGYDRAQLLYAIGKGACIDLPHYIFQLIINAYELQDSRQSLSFRILITNIVKTYGVVIEPRELYTAAMGMINEGTLKKSVGYAGPKNCVKTVSQVSYSQNEGIPVTEGEGSTASPFNMNNIGEKLEQILTGQKYLATQLHAVQESMKGSLEKLESKIDGLYKEFKEFGKKC